MDPNASLKSALQAMAEGNRTEALAALSNLHDWLDKGGFFPTTAAVHAAAPDLQVSAHELLESLERYGPPMVMDSKDSARILLRNLAGATLVAFCDRRGIIELGFKMPLNMLPIATSISREQFTFIAEMADREEGRLFVPGVRINTAEHAAVDKVVAFRNRVAKRLKKHLALA